MHIIDQSGLLVTGQSHTALEQLAISRASVDFGRLPYQAHSYELCTVCNILKRAL